MYSWLKTGVNTFTVCGAPILMVLLPLSILIKIGLHSIIKHNPRNCSGNFETLLFTLLSLIEKYTFH